MREMSYALQRASDDATTCGQGFIPAGDQATAVLATRYSAFILCTLVSAPLHGGPALQED